MRQSVEERFWSKVRRGDGCWPWTGHISKKSGYGQVRVHGVLTYTHRLSVLLDGREIPPKMQIDHLCRTRACVRPSHLEVVTNKENFMRGFAPSAVIHKSGECHRGHNNWRRIKTGYNQCKTCSADRKRAYSKSAALLVWLMLAVSVATAQPVIEAPNVPNGPQCTDPGWYQRVCDASWNFINPAKAGDVIPSGCGSHHDLIYDEDGAQYTMIGQCPDPAHPCTGTQNLYKKPDHAGLALTRWNYYYTDPDAKLHRTLFHYYGPGIPPQGVQTLTPFKTLAQVPDPPRATLMHAYGCIVGTPTPVPSPTPTPSPAPNQFAVYIETIYAAGVTAGCGGGKFCPDRTMTRAEVATWIANALKLPLKPCVGVFTDVVCP